jgi:hypothetical protein
MALRDEVLFAFSKTPYPGDDALTSCNCDDCRWEVARLRGKKWTRLSLDDFGAEDGDSNVTLLTPAAFHYYLPGLLLLVLDHPEETEGWLLSSVISRLTIPENADAATRSTVEGIITRLSTRQREVLVALIEHVPAADHPVRVQSALSNLRDGAVSPYNSAAINAPKRL